MSSRRKVLARLDDWAIPALASGLRGAGAAGRAAGRATGPLGRWAARFARSQPTVVMAVVVAAAAGVLWAATGGNSIKAVRPAAVTVVPPLTDSDLGPGTGDTVDSYTAAAALRRQQLAALPPSQRLEAVVDLSGYLTPQVIQTLLANETQVQILTGFARVAPPADAAVWPLTVGVGGDLASQLAQDQAVQKQKLSRYQLTLRARAAQPNSKRVAELLAAQQPDIPEARVDAKGLGPTCACVFALVVSGPVSQLEQIASLSDVRVLDPAPPSTPAASLRVVPLEPQVTGTVEPLQFARE